MKKTPIIVTIVTIAFMGLGFLLYKVSPPPVSALDLKTFDIGEAQKLTEPRTIGADDHTLGNKDAKNVMVVYEDIQCPVCANFAPILKQVPGAFTDTQVVFRHYPLYPMPHPNSMAAAYAAEAAGAQGKFWEFTDLMYNQQDQWADLKNPLDKMAEIAQASGVANVEQFKSDILSSNYSDKIKKDYLEAIGLDVSGTPTVYFNGQKISYTDNLAALRQQAEALYRK